MGENGAGKSTLMKMLFGLEQPTEGEIYVNGEKVEAYKLQDIFTGIRVTSGINTIEMKYTLPGFKIGVIFSCLGVIVYSLTCFFLFKKQRHF